MTVHATVSPARVGLGDPFTLTVVASGPGTLSAPDGPFVEVNAPRVSHAGGGVRVVKTLVCVDRGCAPDRAPRVVTLPAARLTSGGTTMRAAPVSITLVPRVPAAAVSAARASYVAPTTIPDTSSNLPIGVAAGLAVALAACCVVAAALALRPRRSGGAAELRWDLPLALRLLRESARRPAPDRRRAADLVASLTSDAVATRVAWAPPEPRAADVEQLADRVEHARSGE